MTIGYIIAHLLHLLHKRGNKMAVQAVTCTGIRQDGNGTTFVFSDNTEETFDDAQRLEDYINSALADLSLAKPVLLAHYKAIDETMSNPSLAEGLTCTVDPSNLGTITNE